MSRTNSLSDMKLPERITSSVGSAKKGDAGIAASTSAVSSSGSQTP